MIKNMALWLRRRIKKLERTLNLATSNKWSKWELDYAELVGNNKFLQLKLHEQEKQIADLTAQRNKFAAAVSMWWQNSGFSSCHFCGAAIYAVASTCGAMECQHETDCIVLEAQTQIK